jgi:nitroreductase
MINFGIIRLISVSIKLLFCYLYDFYRFFSHAHLTDPFKTREAARSHIFRLFHALEKGLALPNPRPGFGKEKSVRLLEDIIKYCELYGYDGVTKVALNSVIRVNDFNNKYGIKYEDADRLIAKLLQTLSRFSYEMRGGVIHVEKKEVIQSILNISENFFFSRHSVRQFSEEDVKDELIERAVRIAQQTPSVCNRQSCKVYCLRETKTIAQALKFQNGNKGFGDKIKVLFIITSNLNCFYTIGERNQGLVDGGMFAMSLAYAFHSLGLGACFLNWSVTARHDYRMRSTLNIPDNEVVITYLCAGHLPEKFIVAESPRKDLSDVLFYI